MTVVGGNQAASKRMILIREQELRDRGLAPVADMVLGKGMGRAVKMTFTLDDATAQRIDRAALRLGVPKSRVVREAIAEYTARVGQLSESEHQRMHCLTLNVRDFADIPELDVSRPE